MSVDTNYYLIAGYDLTGMETDKFEDWRWTKDGEGYFCYQSKDRIQLFEDPMCGNHLYLGYILACGDQYDLPTAKLMPTEIEPVYPLVTAEMLLLAHKHGVIQEPSSGWPPFQLIMFEEAS